MTAAKSANLSLLLTTAKAAPLLGVARGTVLHWIATGVIPADQVVWSGNRPRIRLSWIEGRRS